jgi:hypothetical protein
MAKATMNTIAKELDVSANALKSKIGHLYREGNLALAYAKTPEGAVYDVDAVKVAALPFLPELRARREAAAKATAPRPAPSKPHASSWPARSAHVPEVIIIRRRPAQQEER